MKRLAQMLGIALTGLSCAATAAAASHNPAAGLAPYERPAGAPAVKEFTHNEAWRTAALRGVTQPIPDSVNRFLGDQGAWYNPFRHPGMPGPYDIRGLHAPHNPAR